MIKLFRYIGVVEGITTLALFLVAMPLKYWFDLPQFVPTVGMIHGIAFIGYIVAMFVLLRDARFSLLDWTRTAAAAFFPFGTFLNDPFLKRRQAEIEAARA